jgi:hypothetical protein
LQRGDLLAQTGDLGGQRSLVERRCGDRSALLRKDNGWAIRRDGREQRAAMEVSHLLKLGKGQTFETSIGRMRGTGQSGSVEPEPQRFGIDA